jgi:hypothetical protein
MIDLFVGNDEHREREWSRVKFISVCMHLYIYEC